MGVGEVRRLKQLEEENRKLKQLVADLSLDKQMPQDVLSKSTEACCTARIGAGAEVLLCHLRALACQLLNYSRSSFRYQSDASEQAFLRMRAREIAEVRVSYGYLQIHTLLRESWQINHKRVYRIYRQEGLMLRRRGPQRHVTAKRRGQ